MFHGLRIKSITLVYSIILSISCVFFSVLVIVSSIIYANKYDYEKISCRVILKYNDLENVYLTYCVKNGTGTDIESLDVTTRFYLVGSTTNSSFSTTFNAYFDPIPKNGQKNFDVRITDSLTSYSFLKNNDLNVLTFVFYLNRVTFSDNTTKQNLNYQMK